MSDLRGGNRSPELLLKHFEYDVGRLERTRKKKELEIEDRTAEIENFKYKSELELIQIDEQVEEARQKVVEHKKEHNLVSGVDDSDG